MKRYAITLSSGTEKIVEADFFRYPSRVEEVYSPILFFSSESEDPIAAFALAITVCIEYLGEVDG